MPDAQRGSAGPPDGQREPSMLALSGLGMQLFVAVAVFVYAGNWVDQRWHTSPVFVLVGLFVGGGGTFYAGYRRLMRDQGGTRRNTSKDDGDST